MIQTKNDYQSRKSDQGWHREEVTQRFNTFIFKEIYTVWKFK